MTPLAATPPLATKTTLGASPVKGGADQSGIQKGIDDMWLQLQRNPGDSKTHAANLQKVMTQINSAKDARHASSIFGSAATNREENFYLLSTLLQDAQVPETLKTDLRESLNKNFADLTRKGPVPDKAVAVEMQVLRAAGEIVKSRPVQAAAKQPVATPARQLTVGTQKFTIETTTGGGSNDCLAYALRAKNEGLDRNYRASTFTEANIGQQLLRMQQRMLDNEVAEGDSVIMLRTSIEANYDRINLDGASDIQSLSKILAQHIQETRCMLDSSIGGGVFAAAMEQPLVIVNQPDTGPMAFSVFNSNGHAVYQGSQLESVGIDLSAAKYVHHNNRGHFERMTRAA